MQIFVSFLPGISARRYLFACSIPVSRDPRRYTTFWPRLRPSNGICTLSLEIISSTSSTNFLSASIPFFKNKIHTCLARIYSFGTTVEYKRSIRVRLTQDTSFSSSRNHLPYRNVTCIHSHEARTQLLYARTTRNLHSELSASFSSISDNHFFWYILINYSYPTNFKLGRKKSFIPKVSHRFWIIHEFQIEWKLQSCSSTFLLFFVRLKSY